MKRLAILLFALFLVSSVAASGFSDTRGITPFTAPTEVNVSTHVFKIPTGFGEDGSSRKIAYDMTIKGNNYTTWESDYIDDNGSVISICIYSQKDNVSLDSLKDNESEQKTIEGHEGWFKELEDSYYFAYVEEGDGVRIYAPSEEILENLFK